MLHTLEVMLHYRNSTYFQAFIRQLLNSIWDNYGK
jgi:hypothetical protein